jgi:dCTP deaminase
LGNEFIVARPSLLSKIDPAEFDLNLNQMHTQTKIYIPFGKPFVLHPGQFVLGSTLEYFKIPDDIMGLLIGRSSWGRLGLSIATPNKINPGFSGSLTLQIGNLGNIPIQLYPCARLGQIIFIKSKGANK